MHLSFSQIVEYAAKQVENLSSTTPPQDPFLVNYEHEATKSTAGYSQDPSDSQSLRSTSLTTRNEINKSTFPHEIFHLNIATEPTRESKESISYRV